MARLRRGPVPTLSSSRKKSQAEPFRPGLSGHQSGDFPARAVLASASMSDQATQRAIIHASPERCFDVAIDFERYPAWASDIKSATVLRERRRRGGEVEFRARPWGRTLSPAHN